MSDSNILWVPDEDDRPEMYADAVLDWLPVMVWQGTKDGMHRFHNRTWLEYTGRTADQEFGVGWLDSVHPDDRKQLTEPLSADSLAEQTLIREYRLRHFSDDYHWIREEIKEVPSRSNRSAVLVGCCYDMQADRDRSERQQVIWQDTESNRQWLEVTLASIADGVIATDTTGKVTYLNPVAEHMTGFSNQDAHGLGVDEIFSITSEMTGESVEVPVYQVIAKGRVVGMANHTELTARDGTRRPIADSAAPIRAPNGEILGVVMVFQDMTYRKETEMKIANLLADYEQIFMGVGHPLFLVDVEPGLVFRYRRFNPANEKLVGITTADILGRTPVEVFGTEAGSEIEQRFMECVQKGVPFTYVGRRTFAAGFVIQRVQISPVIQDGQVIQLVGSALDLTDQILTEEALRDSEIRFRSLFDNLEDMACVYRFDPDGPPGPFVEVNETMQEMLGYKREELLAMGPACLDPAEDMAATYGPVKQVLRDAGRAEFNVMLRTRDGQLIPAEARATQINYRGENCVLATLRDVTERRQWETRLQHHLEIEKAISRVLNLLIRGEQVDFERICAILGEAVDCSTTFMYLMDDEGVLARKIAQWAAPHVQTVLPVGRHVDTRKMTWYPSMLREEGVIVMTDIRNMPEEAALERKDLESGAIRALLNVAFFAKDGRMLGYFGFTDHRGPRQWRNEDIELLRSVAEVMGIHFDQKETEAKIRHISFHDQVTGLFNRAYFEVELKRLDTSRQLPLSILIGDVNGLKLINDAFGHSEGDRFLAGIGGTLKRVCRQEDLVARWGGDEFIILLPQTDEKAAEALIERIRSALAEDDDELLMVSMALGVATKVREEQPVDRVIREAEDRMYQNKLLESQSFRSAVISSLESTLWERSNETEEHTRRMQSWAVRLGRKVGLSESRQDELRLLTSLHDIGKIAIPDHILNKPGLLNAEEWVIMRRHAEIGYRIASASSDLLPIANGILTHHEWWDGTGYPQGLMGEEIPVTARIVAVVDAYDVMRHDRPYRKALSHEEAVMELQKNAGSQFDPEIVNLFIAILAETEEQPDQDWERS
jgi:diguanylate cyclase